MRLVVKKWEKLYKHIEDLLHQDFMDPTTYVELLFDDENLVNQGYTFGQLGVSTNFELPSKTTSSNGTLFRDARVKPYLENDRGGKSRDKDSLSKSSETKMGDQKKIQDLAKEIDALVESLIDWHSQFKHQQETAQAFRDGLFNASALMESRASTSLGEKVKLLTYVSIFYLPLAFYAALWTIPNITSSGTRTPFMLTTILVGFLIYMIVFNLGNIVNQSRSVYGPYRSEVIKQTYEQISNDTNSWISQFPASKYNEFESKWEMRTERFKSTFGPKRGDGEPSEWWITICSVVILYRWLLVHFKNSFQWISRFFSKIFVSFGNAFQWIRQLFEFPRDSTSNNSQEDSTSNHTQETV